MYKLVKKDNFVKSIALLALIAGIAFFAFENRQVFADTLTRRPTTQTGLTPQTPAPTTTTTDEPTPLIQPSQQNRQQGQIIQGARRTPVIIQQSPTQIVQQPQERVQRIERVITQAETQPLVRRPEFLARSDILNPKAFNIRKFGIDPELARRALKTPEPQQTRAQKLQLANLRAMETFRSSDITNF